MVLITLLESQSVDSSGTKDFTTVCTEVVRVKSSIV